jgi:hypothetical protein
VRIISPARGAQDPAHILIELANGERRFIPVAWTNLKTQPDYPPGMRFKLEQLVDLRQQIDRMLAAQGKMVVESEIEAAGDSHANTSQKNMGSIERPTAGPHHCDPGRNALRPHPEADGGER